MKRPRPVPYFAAVAAIAAVVGVGTTVIVNQNRDRSTATAGTVAQHAAENRPRLLIPTIKTSAVRSGRQPGIHLSAIKRDDSVWERRLEAKAIPRS